MTNPTSAPTPEPHFIRPGDSDDTPTEVPRYYVTREHLSQLDGWLRDEVVPAAVALRDDPSSGQTIIQARAELAKRRDERKAK